MKNKAYLVKRLCELKGLDLDSSEAQDLYSLKIVDLLIELKKLKPEVQVRPQEDEDEGEELLSLAQRVGCT
jgi:hypothetical protein